MDNNQIEALACMTCGVSLTKDAAIKRYTDRYECAACHDARLKEEAAKQALSEREVLIAFRFMQAVDKWGTITSFSAGPFAYRTSFVVASKVGDVERHYTVVVEEVSEGK